MAQLYLIWPDELFRVCWTCSKLLLLGSLWRRREETKVRLQFVIVLEARGGKWSPTSAPLDERNEVFTVDRNREVLEMRATPTLLSLNELEEVVAADHQYQAHQRTSGFKSKLITCSYRNALLL